MIYISRILTIILTMGVSLNIYSQTPCVDGTANGHPCHNVDLLSHVSPDVLLAEEHGGGFLNDIWGWTDPETGKEYALVGMVNGTSFVDVSDPIYPIVLGILPEHHAAETNSKLKHDGAKSVWRDIKVYKNHAYIVAEDNGHGMQVFDLTQLRNVPNPPIEFAETANYDGIGKAHNIVINEETGFAYAVGANSPGYSCNDGGLHMIDIREPANPVFAGCYDADGYTHDAQCVIYTGPDTDYQGREICFAANEDEITLVDVTNKSNPEMISKKTYTGVQYAHQGWLTNDQRYFISNDEVDELDNGTNTTSYMWDMQDLDNPVFIGEYVSDLTSIDHNLYIIDALAYESNYTSGLRILNIHDIENGNLKEVAYFDTYPMNDAVIFEGAWSNYPFFESGIVVVSDITRGLYVLQPNLSNLNQTEAEEICMDDEALIKFHPIKFDFEYQWQVNSGNGFFDIENNELYNGTNTKSLLISSFSEVMQGNKYRLKYNEPGSLEENYSEDISVSIKDMPEAGFEVINEESYVEFNNLSLNADSYLWNFGDGSEEVESTNPIHSYTLDGEYEVTLQAFNECGSDEMSMVYNKITAITDLELAAGLHIFPNPTQNLINIQYENVASTVTSISLFTISGQQVLQKRIYPFEDNRYHQLDINSFEKGIYILKIDSQKGMVSQRIVVK